MASSAPKIVEIELRKGTTGLGFNIRGGTDNMHTSTDPGIFVTTIRSDGAAGQDGRLQVGDKILAVNGVSLREVKHGEAVRCFQESKDVVRIVVEAGAEGRIQKESSNPAAPPPSLGKPRGVPEDNPAESTSNTLKFLIVAGVVVAAIVVVAIVLQKRR